ncbi:adenine nucleotide alpha hydrolase [Nitrospira sp.]|nr:adenine nucleotide alpha hydrolase [Nitrospira sp.]
MSLTTHITQKLAALGTMVDRMQSVLVAFSGGIDSTLVLHVAHDRLGPDAVAVTSVSATLPERERLDCERLARRIGARHLWQTTDQLALPAFALNDATRCYHCKTDLYSALNRIRLELGLCQIVNGVQQDDFDDDRPGLLAAREWSVRSPLVEAGFKKADVRTAARHLGLPNWDKPAAACLSSRIPRGLPITYESLARVEAAESLLLEEGFRQVRVRDFGGVARLEVGAEEVRELLTILPSRDIERRICALGFESVEVDREGYRPGKANERSLISLR